VEVHLLVQDSLFGADRVVFRVSPWIMTPNTLPVEQVYACDMTTDLVPNSEFLSGLREACEELDIPLTIVPPNETRRKPTDPYGDRWIQDEIEFGFSQDAKHTLPVVCDSPRDRELDQFPELRLLGPDFGHFQIGSSEPNSLDSFGNLEVSPPVTVRGRHYPMGRIVFGGRAYGDYHKDIRQMMSELRRLLYAQKVQRPVELYTDWLTVGHVDEIISFVPAATEEGFKTLLASPKKAQAILQGLSDGGFGSAVLFKGKERRDPEDPEGRRWVSAESTVDELLAQTEFWEINMEFQQCMDQN
jgi:protein-arginine deiminase